MLDKKDSKLVSELLMNARTPLVTLSKSCQLKRENVAYRMARLEKQGIIKGYGAIINTTHFGFKQYVILFQLEKLKESKEKEIMDFLISTGYISWIGVLTGRWSLTFDIYARDETDVSEKLKSIFHNLENHIADYSFLCLSEKEYFYNKLIKSKNLTIQKPVVKHSTDKLDSKILQLLNQNARITYADLSPRLHLTANAIKRRIKQLEKSGIILGYTAYIDPTKMGLEWYGIELKQLKFDESDEKKIKHFLRIHPSVVFYYKYVDSSWSVGVLVKNPQELRKFISQLRYELSEEVKLNDFFIVLSEVTTYSLPKCVFQ